MRLDLPRADESRAALGVPQHDAPQRAHRLAAALQLAGDDRFGNGHLFRYGDRRRALSLRRGGRLPGLRRRIRSATDRPRIYEPLRRRDARTALPDARRTAGPRHVPGPGHRPREQPGAFPLPPGHEARPGNLRRLFPRTLHHPTASKSPTAGRPASNR